VREQRHTVVGDDGSAHADGDLLLRAGAALPVGADRVAAKEGLAEDAGPVGGIRGEQVGLRRRLLSPRPAVALDPLVGSHPS